jgi:hypothetical protein
MIAVILGQLKQAVEANLDFLVLLIDGDKVTQGQLILYNYKLIKNQAIVKPETHYIGI